MKNRLLVQMGGVFNLIKIGVISAIGKLTPPVGVWLNYVAGC